MEFDFEPFLRYVNKSTDFIDDVVTVRDCHMIYILSGDGTFESDGGGISLRAHTLVYYPYGKPYKIRGNPENKLLFYTLNFDFSRDYQNIRLMRPIPVSKKGAPVLDTIPVSLRSVFAEVFAIENAFPLESMIAGMLKERLSPTVGSEQICEMLLKMLLIRIYRQKAIPSQANPICEKVKRLVRQNPELNVAEIAGRLNYHPYYLSEVFKKHEACTLHQYQIRQRLLKANELCATTNLPFAEIALMCGFCSQSHMTDAFRKIYGITPSYFRK